MTKKENRIVLISITLCWSFSYLFIKNLPEDLSSYAYLTLTTGIAALLMTVIFAGQLKKLRKSAWLRGFLLSLILTVNLLAEKKGIALLAPENASFISALTILFVPLFLLLFRKKPTPNEFIGAFVIIVGLCVSTGFKPGGFLNRGTLYMLAGCISSAIYTIAVDRYAKEENPLLICIVQMIFTALTAWILWYMEEPKTFTSLVYTREMLSSVLILAFFTKAYAYIALMFAQKYTDAVSVTVLAAMEPVITLLLAVLVPAAYGGGSGANILNVTGAFIITAGAIMAGFTFLEKVNWRMLFTVFNRKGR